MQKKSIAKFDANRTGMIDQYLKDNGKIINTDEARKYFKDVGYKGSNAAAVQEASSALAKEAYVRALKENPGDKALIFAGGSGTGKTSVVKKLLPGDYADASAVLDGNLSSIGSAEKRIKEARDAGKEPIITYVYRDPVDAWINGVIKRMKDNASEGGRLVPLSVFLDNHIGSYDVTKQLSKMRDIEVQLIDNSLGKNKAQMMPVDKFNKINYNKDTLRSKLLEVTKQEYEHGNITEEQYKALIA